MFALQFSYDTSAQSPPSLTLPKSISARWTAIVFDCGCFVMKLIPLSQWGKNRGKYFAKVDDEDYDWLMQWRWSVEVKNGDILYATRKNGNSTYYMHRQILNLTDRKLQADHINHDGLDNRRLNLRAVTRAQNLANVRPKIYKYKGVSKSKNGKRWCANIKKNDIKYRIGTFDSCEDAAKAYNDKAKELNGEFAYLNKI